LGSDSVTVDLASSPALLTTEQLQTIEDTVNDYIRQVLPVQYTVIPKEEFDSFHDQDLRGQVKGAAMELSSLRLVRIQDLDLNPCGGTHIQHLGELNLLKILGFEKDRKAIRVRFVAGNRALRYFQIGLQRETIFSNKLSAPPQEHVKIIEKLLGEKKDLEKKYETSQEELAVYFALSLLSRSHSNQGTSTIISLLHKHKTGASLKFLLKAASVILEQRSAEEVLVYLTGGDIEDPSEGAVAGALATAKGKAKKDSKKKDVSPTAVDVLSNESFPFVLAGSPVVVDAIKADLLSILKAKGGGRPGLLQGQSSILMEAKEEVLALIRQRLEAQTTK
jgi:alanyl-tRNA synthetase